MSKRITALEALNKLQSIADDVSDLSGDDNSLSDEEFENLTDESDYEDEEEEIASNVVENHEQVVIQSAQPICASALTIEPTTSIHVPPKKKRGRPPKKNQSSLTTAIQHSNCLSQNVLAAASSFVNAANATNTVTVSSSSTSFTTVDGDVINLNIDTSSKDKIEWTKMQVNDFKKIRNQISFKEKTGVTNFAKNKIDDSALSSFFCIFDQSIISLIIKGTKAKAAVKNDKDFEFEKLDLLRFIAVLLARGVLCNRIPVRNMWSKKFGVPYIGHFLGKNRFLKINKFLRFDDLSSRSTRVLEDKFCLVRDIWNRFIENSIACYRPTKWLTVDEQLLPCLTRCSFIQYMPNKPDKFGIKFWLLCEVEEKYICNGFVYLGANDTRSSNDTLGSFVVKELMAPFLNKGYCVSTDNFFTRLDLSQNLFKNKTTCVGTIKRQLKEMPSFMCKPKYQAV